MTRDKTPSEIDAIDSLVAVTADRVARGGLATISSIVGSDAQSVKPVTYAVGVVVGVFAASDGLTANTGVSRPSIGQRRGDDRGGGSENEQDGSDGEAHGGYFGKGKELFMNRKRKWSEEKRVQQKEL